MRRNSFFPEQFFPAENPNPNFSVSMCSTGLCAFLFCHQGVRSKGRPQPNTSIAHTPRWCFSQV